MALELPKNVALISRQILWIFHLKMIDNFVYLDLTWHDEFLRWIYMT